jgi:metal-sulfur cluster biosynthetic enzyme
VSGRSPVPARIIATAALVGAGVLLMLGPSLLRRGRQGLPDLTAGFSYSDSAEPAVRAAAPESTEVVAALGRVIDPEIDLSVIDLGLLESLRVDMSGNVRVVLALTTPECPLYALIGRDALAELRRLPGARRATVRLEPDAAWDPSRMTEEGRRKYREAFGDSAGR